MSEGDPKPQKKVVTAEEVVEILKTKGKDDPEAKELLSRWIIQEEELAAEANGGRANVVVSMSQAFLFSEAGLLKEALDSYRDALYQARQEGETDLEEMMRAEIEKLERLAYDEGDLLHEAEDASRDRLTHISNEADRIHETSLDGEGLVKKFLNNFSGHLPEGYKRTLRVGKLEEDIDAAIERLGIDREKIKEYQSNPPALQEEKDEWLGILKILYIEMRRLGHKHYPDLTS